MTKNEIVEDVRKKYDSYSLFYDLLLWPAEKVFFSKWRKFAFSDLDGKILEVGVGTGNNLAYYSEKANVTGIDISRGMLSKAKVKAKKQGLNVKLIKMSTNQLKFKPKTFDYVVCTFVICSVPDAVKVMKEMRRVLKSKGKIIMIEHVLSSNKLLAFLQNVPNPLARELFGFSINRSARSIKASMREADLNVLEDQKLAFFGVFRKFTCCKG